ncbi:MAG: FAD-dependent monooxygenase [Acidobacteria bacterium]|nr:FAD-dependent monooxygenase [Acidobacteriota bacterium]
MQERRCGLIERMVSSPEPELDVIIAGASLAGSTAAHLLGAAGFRVLLLEKASFPRPKICGEGLMPSGVRLLHQAGMLEAGNPGGVPFKGIRLIAGGLPALSLGFNHLRAHDYGLVVDRLKLDAQMAARAARCPNVTLLERSAVKFVDFGETAVEVLADVKGVRQGFRARVLLGADGIRSEVRRLAGVPICRPRRKRFALRALGRPRQDDFETVEVYFTSRGEAYVAPRRGGRVTISLLIDGTAAGALRGGARSSFEAALELFPELRSRVALPRGSDTFEATAPLSLMTDRAHGNRLLLIGDAAGAVDPITGQGMTLALRDACLALAVLKPRIPRDRLLAGELSEFTRKRNKYFSSAWRFAERLLDLFENPAAARKAVLALRRRPALQERLAEALALGRPELLGWYGRARMLAGAPVSIWMKKAAKPSSRSCSFCRSRVPSRG